MASIIVKIGGNVINNPTKLDEFLTLFAGADARRILVHGGGKVASEIMSTMGIEPKMVEGRRVTDAETLKVVQMVYGGLINKNIVASLQQKGVNAIGLTGADANVIQAHKRPVKTVDYGFVGDVDGVDASVLAGLMDLGLRPILAPLTHDGKGQMLNTNADTIASVAAVGLSQKEAVRLVYCFELEGVMKDINQPESLIETITPESYEQLKADNIVAAGMIPKLDNAFDALKAGVSEVIICKAERVKDILNGKAAGTSIRLA